MSDLPANINTLLDGLEKAKTRMTTEASGDASFIKMTRAGMWVYGADDLDIEPDSVWAVNPNSFISGFVAWGDTGTPLGEEMRSIMEDPIVMVDLQDVGAKWTQQFGFEMACTNGEDKGVQVIYKTNSKGGRNAVSALLDEVLHHIKENPSDPAVVPLVTLGSSSYKHKKFGKVYTPLFSLESWATIDGVQPAKLEEPEAEPEPEPAPPTRRRRRAK
jgi:hypothetical protein